VLTREAADNYMRLIKRYDENQRLSDVEFSLLISHNEKMKKHFGELLELPILPEHVKYTRLELQSKMETAIMLKNNIYLEALKSNPNFKLNLNREGGQTGTYKDLISHAWVSFVLPPFRGVLPPFR
jgi:hypothetical protein